MFLDEAFYAGSKQTKNGLKTKITEETINVKEKYVEEYQVENMFNVIIASNEEHVINLDAGQRRYLVLELDDSYAGNHNASSKEYNHFQSILETDLQLLSNYFHSLQVEDWNEKELPQTEATITQIERSLDSHYQCLRDILNDHTLITLAKVYSSDKENLEGMYMRNQVYQIYAQSYPSSFKLKQSELWKMFQRAVPSIRMPRIQVNRSRLIEFPSTIKARNEFRASLKLHKQKFEDEN